MLKPSCSPALVTAETVEWKVEGGSCFYLHAKPVYAKLINRYIILGFTLMRLQVRHIYLLLLPL